MSIVTLLNEVKSNVVGEVEAKILVIPTLNLNSYFMCMEVQHRWSIEENNL